MNFFHVPIMLAVEHNTKTGEAYISVPIGTTSTDELVSFFKRMQTESPSEPAGVWAVMGQDHRTYPIPVWPTELEARRHSDQLGYGEVYWWPWGEWAEAQH